MLGSGVFLLVCFTLAQAQPAQPSTETQEFTRLEAVWNQAHVNGDAAALEQLWADDLEVAVPRMPVMSKSDVLAFARSGRMRFQRYARLWGCRRGHRAFTTNAYPQRPADE